jgi:two-component system, response regulator YesN
MLKILIADDERIIRRGLKDLLEAQDGFCVLQAVANGVEALQAIEEERPDVVLTDIRMPKMDGRELVRALHKTYPAIRKIVISGYEDFTYAHESMKNGAIDYLLKPVDEKELVGLLRGIEAEVAGEEKRRDEDRTLQSKLAQSLPLLREEFVLGLLHGCGLADGEIAERLDYLGMDAGAGPYCAAVLSAVGSRQTGVGQGSASGGAGLARLAVEASQGLALCLACEEGGTAACILCRPAGFEGEWTAEAAVVAIYGAMKRELKSGAAVGVGSLAVRLSNVSESYREAAQALKRRFYDEEAGVFRHEGRQKPPAGKPAGQIPENYAEKFFADFANAMEMERPEDIKALLSAANSLLKENRVDANEALKLFSDLFSALQTQNAGFRRAMNELYGPDWLYFKAIEKFDTLGGIIAYSTGIYLEMLEKIKTNRSRKDKKRVEVVKEYVEKNYRENITLAKIAEMVYMNPNYFCEVFKSQAGENFIDYVTRVRVEKAKALLRDMKIKTYEVSALVGYDDPGYFSKVFKKFVGITPGEYKNLKI